MLITDLIPKGKRQSIVCLDGTPAGFLDNRDISAYRLEAGGEVNEVTWAKIVEETILPRGKRKALELLQLQDRTTKELHDKLVSGDYTEEQTREIIAYVASFRYIDERRYAVNWFRSHAKNKSFREMQQTLLMRGVEQETITAAYEQFCSEFSNENGSGEAADPSGEDASGDTAEVLAVRRFVSRRVKGTEMTADERRKVYAGLARKGFSQDAIRKVLSGYQTVGPEDSE
ncbi:MAG: regulatory protein RecX [Lachnospiraceae bacterium]|nr:regulatory protein RecX [Lachnospiraceae bacterium]